MSLKAKVKNAVDIAFTQLKDLSYEAVFTNQEVEDFNFSTAQIVGSDSTYTTFGFLETKKVYKEGSVVTMTTFTIKSDPSIDYNRYTEVDIDNQSYRCSLLNQDEYITVLSLVRL